MKFPWKIGYSKQNKYKKKVKRWLSEKGAIFYDK